MSMLPKAPRGFDWIEIAGAPALVCRDLASIAPHFFTTRTWAIGSPNPGNGAWRSVADAAGVPCILRLRQVHGAEIVVHRRGAAPADDLPAADIIISNDDHAAIAVQAADCVPLLVADCAGGAVAAAHAGWRGLAAGVPARAVEALVSEFGSRAGQLIAVVGPSIGACCYEVGSDVRDAFDRPFGRASAAWFHEAPLALPGNPPFRLLRPQAERWYFDAWASARDQLASAGVPADQIHVAELCTASHPGAFPSYRRESTAAGRLAAVIRRTSV